MSKIKQSARRGRRAAKSIMYKSHVGRKNSNRGRAYRAATIADYPDLQKLVDSFSGYESSKEWFDDHEEEYKKLFSEHNVLQTFANTITRWSDQFRVQLEQFGYSLDSDLNKISDTQWIELTVSAIDKYIDFAENFFNDLNAAHAELSGRYAALDDFITMPYSIGR